MSSKNDDRTRMTRLPLACLLFIRPSLSLLGAACLLLAASSHPARAQAEAAAASAPAEAAASAPIVNTPPPVAPQPRPPRTAPLTSPTTLLPPPLWQELGPNQKQALAPLERDWDRLDPSQRSKWLEMAPRFASLPPEEQARLHERMRDWARMSPVERQQARVGFQAAQQLHTGDRQAKWEAYQALPPEKRQELAEKAAQKQQADKHGGGAKPRPAPAADAAQPKSNLVPAPAKGLPLKPVAPSVLQAKPGASTVLITQGVTPPTHQQAGQTKVFADPELVDSKTLLPKPQATASR
ncbi:DUF3106 domain-containing protein [Roseateles violae]|uniref:DUF3106 domain-containing protein n=1 Tax=Roseateles violae TaxID=3058042 RepID=A0ABT8DZK1_9BURK|nr:DUF3106 domain-containing protein [Pelomonas sp. PFR6]MDN3922975.1 DUF3106 domain-containing protein [Pelomonas sp. PFR6]